MSSPDPYDPTTWPEGATADDLKGLLAPYVRPGVTAVTQYSVLHFAHQHKSFETINSILKELLVPPKPRVIAVEAYLNRHLNNSEDPYDMELVARTPPDLGFDGSSKPLILWLYSMRGSGKTAMLKYMVFKLFDDACQRGRVIARCCQRSQQGLAPWIVAALAFDPHKAFRLLVEEHLREVVRPDISIPTGADVYDVWMRETAGKYNATSPCTVLLDTCEILAVAVSQVPHSMPPEMKTAPPEMKTALELLCGVASNRHRFVVVGCNAKITTDSLVLTGYNVKPLDSLLPIPFEARHMIGTVWKATFNSTVWEIFHELTGGTPRLLRLVAATKTEVCMSGSCYDAPRLCFDQWLGKVRALYPPPTDNSWTRALYWLALGSCVKFPIQKDGPILMPASERGAASLTYAHAVHHSWGMVIPLANADAFLVPPILAADYFRSEKPVNLQNLIPLEGYKDAFGSGAPTDRGIPFEHCFAHALHARYELCRARSGTDWVALGDVLVGATRNDLSGYTTNLSGGVVSRKGQTTYAQAATAFEQGTCEIVWCNADQTAHHDMYIPVCFLTPTDEPVQKNARVDEGPKVLPMAVNMRHGKPKTDSELNNTLQWNKQKSKEHASPPIDLPLLVVTPQENTEKYTHQTIKVTAENMLVCKWIWAVAKVKDE